MKEYQAIYKCRFCGKYFVNKYQNVSEEHWKEYGGSPRATAFHDCFDGCRAAGDFVFYVLADEEEIQNKLNKLNENASTPEFVSLVAMSDDFVIDTQNRGKM